MVIFCLFVCSFLLMGIFSFFPECGFWVSWSGSVYFVAAFSCCFRGFAGWVFLGNLWCGKMGEANTLWRKIWDACRDGSLIWFCRWCGGFNKLGLWGNSQTRKWVTFQLIFACNSWLHSLRISVSFSFSSFIFVTDLLLMARSFLILTHFLLERVHQDLFYPLVYYSWWWLCLFFFFFLFLFDSCRDLVGWVSEKEKSF